MWLQGQILHGGTCLLKRGMAPPCSETPALCNLDTSCSQMPQAPGIVESAGAISGS